MHCGSSDFAWVVKKEYRGKACDEVCLLAGFERCDQEELDLLNGRHVDSESYKGRYALAGRACKVMHIHCEGGNNCVNWGSPYVHTYVYSKSELERNFVLTFKFF